MEVNTDIVLPIKVYGDVCLRKARRKRQKLLIMEMLSDYARNTTLHGIPYITRRGVSLAEKIFWMITFIMSVSMCTYLIFRVWIKWRASPVIVTVSEYMVPVSMVPFPSVTICPQSKFKISDYNFTRDNEYFEKEFNLLYTALVSGGDYTPPPDLHERFSKWDTMNMICRHKKVYFSIDTRRNTSTVQQLKEVSQNYSDIFERCVWRNQTKICSQLFHKMVTREGICFNMNSLGPDEILRTENIQEPSKYLESDKISKGWTAKDGYTNPFDFSSYPIHGMENGAGPDLVIFLRINKAERDYECNPFASGFKIFLHHPADLPQTSLYYYAALEGQQSSMALSFSVLNTSESLSDYSAETRQCYFDGNRYLKYFKIYSESNCRLECLTNATFKMCHCVAFYMPHETEEICQYAAWPCIVRAEESMVYNESNNINGCHCLPSCNAVEYEAEILKTAYNKRDYYERIGVTDKYHPSDLEYSKLEIYYKKPRYLSMRRSELYGPVDFLANCGGLLGLFLGFSFLSLVEVFYFLTLRLWCTLKKDWEEEKTARIEEAKENAEVEEKKKF